VDDQLGRLTLVFTSCSIDGSTATSGFKSCSNRRMFDQIDRPSGLSFGGCFANC
jgi:hypothetical protein